MELCRISDPKLLEGVYRLRAEVWQHLATDPFPARGWLDEHDAHALHWAMVEAGSGRAEQPLSIS